MVEGIANRAKPVQDVAQFFDYHHLTGILRDVSVLLCDTVEEALEIITTDSAELTAGLRKLLEAKDCLVRAALIQERVTDERTPD